MQIKRLPRHTNIGRGTTPRRNIDVGEVVAEYHGFRRFTFRSIIIFYILGELISKKEGEHRLDQRALEGIQHDYVLFFEFAGKHLWFVSFSSVSSVRSLCSLDGTESLSKARLINHSRLYPNARLQLQQDGKGCHVILVATKQIKVGDEIKFVPSHFFFKLIIQEIRLWGGRF